ncbi:HCL595Wp [Eremothecium sinecaudum]|uniref:HCL595Wp n=1 Tax=Eremothecium sinecaudum TaxID=45286 RepID=A0A109UXV6_9SACH|nr:HCL595Wp [Eremothecium sinecaudum]AMD19556.1 HCL595Wp [Eremothecium sinecaudum]
MPHYLTRTLHRNYQVELLNAFTNNDPDLSPPNIIVHGFRSTGKTTTLKEYFNSRHELLSCWVNAVEMVTGKPFAQHVAVQVSRILKDKFPGIAAKEYDPLSAEDFSLLAKFLYNTFAQYQNLDKRYGIYVILDEFDKIDELDIELLPKFLKLHELIPNIFKLEIRFIHVISGSSFLGYYCNYNIPTIVFPIYNQDETSDIVHHVKGKELGSCPQLSSKIEQFESPVHSQRLCNEIAKNFITLIIQAFHSYTGNDPAILIEMIEGKWDSYVDSITEQNYKDPPALYKANLELFKNTGDTLIGNDDDNEIEDYGNENLNKTDQNGSTSKSITKSQFTNNAYEISTMSKYLLIAAYLTSYLNPRFDSKVFSKKSHLRAGRSSYGRRHKMDTNPRYLQPSLFSLERLLAIFQSIYPVHISKELHSDFIQKDTHMRANVEVYENLSELNSLKLITSAINKSVDYLHEKVKWKVNVSWEIITEISRTVDFDIAEYFSDIHE